MGVSANYESCFTNGSGRILPYAFIAGFWGAVKMLSTQWGFLTTLDVPPYDGDEEGAHNVQTVYYLLDSFGELFWSFLELTVGVAALTISAWMIVVYNIIGNSWWPYIWAGVLQLYALVFWVFSLLVRFVYALVNIDWILTNYSDETYSTIVFPNPLTVTSTHTEGLESLIWWEQLLFGPKRSMLYANILMFITLSLHPMTFIFAWFFAFQIPFQVLLDGLVYPFFPQFDSPYIPWVEYIALIREQLEGPPPEEQEVEEKGSDDGDDEDDEDDEEEEE